MLKAGRSQDNEAPWTASRCNRTLRQLTAFLAKAEKWHRDLSQKSLGPIGETENDQESGPSLEPICDEAIVEDPKWLCKQDRKLAGKCYARRRKPCRGRGPAQQAKHLPYTPKAPKTAEVIIDTPMMASILTPTHVGSCELSHHVQSPDAEKKPPPRPRVAWLRRGICEEVTKEAKAPSRSKWLGLTTDEMKQIVNSFLAATSQTQVIGEASNEDSYPCKGSKSLFSSCLHKIPTLIIAEQSQHDMTSDGYDGEVQVASTLLRDLEDHYGDSYRGWRPLRVVTRVYGIALVCNAIRKHVLPIEAAMSLEFSLTKWFGVNDATEAIADAIVEVRQMASVDDLTGILTGSSDVTEPQRDPSSQSSIAKNYAAGLKFRFTETAFRRTSEPVAFDFISARPTFLKDAIRSCSQGWPPDAISLVKTLLLRFLDLSPGHVEALTAQVRKDPENFIGVLEDITIDDDGSLLPRDAVDDFAPKMSHATKVTVSTFRSTLVALAAFPLSRKVRQRRSNTEKLRNSSAQSASVCILRDICLAVQVDMEIHGVTQWTHEQFQRRAWILFAYCLLAKMLPLPKTSHSLTASMATLILSCESRKCLVADLSSFVLEILTACDRTYERRKRVHSLSVLKEMTNSLISHTPCHSPVVALLFSNVAVEASMAYAQIGRKDETDALLWATELQRQVQTSLGGEDILLPTPSLKTTRKGFRWDDCIFEWVAITPSPAKMHLMGARLDLGDDQPSSLAPSLGKAMPTPLVSMPVSPIDESMSRRMKKRKNAPEMTELHWDGDFAFRRPVKRGKSLGEEIVLSKPLVDLDSEDELGGGY